MVCPLIALSLLLFAAVAYAGIPGQRPVSTIVYGPAPGQRYGTAAASDGRDFLVAWVETGRNRSAVPQLYAARMNAAGELLDRLAIHIPVTSTRAGFVNVVFLGNAYLVFWSEPLAGAPSVTSLLAVRINRDGVLLDAAPRVLASRSLFGPYAAASNGNRTVMLFRGPGVSAIMIVLDRDGEVVAGPKTFTNFGVTSAMVASNGRGFLIAWSLDAIYETLLDDTGTVTTPEKIPVSSGRTLYALASDGDGYVVIAGDSTNVAAQHVSGDGQLLERSVVAAPQLFAGFVFAAGSYVLMDSDLQAHTMALRRLDRTGKPVGDDVPVTEALGSGDRGSLASNGSDTAVFWTDLSAAVPAFNGAVLHANASALTNAVPIALSANPQYWPRAATNGRNIAVVWEESGGTYTGRLTIDGEILDGRGIRIGDASIVRPDIVFDGSNYLIGWVESSGSKLVSTVKVARLFPPFGTPLDPAGITVASSSCVNAVSLAAGAASTLVAWSDCTHILASTVDQSGLPGTSTVVTAAETVRTGAVSAAWNGREWLVAWENRIPMPLPIEGTDTQTFVKAARLSASLALLDTPSISLTDTTSDAGPVVASDGNDFLVAWTRTPAGVFAQRISADGSLLAIANGVHIGRGNATSVVWDGLQYDIAFSSYGGPSTLYVTHVAAEGAIEGTAAQTVVSNVVAPDAALIVSQPGRVVAVYSLVAPEAIYGSVERLFIGVLHAIRARAASVQSNP